MLELPLFESKLLIDMRVGQEPTRLIPERKPAPGEQYRFHFDMEKCIGCKCCVVACNQQNGNPADILWRRVGEVEGGVYPNTQRHYLSMGCNHCVEPTCLPACPVKAYTKDLTTGVVLHDADTCIGCQYCTWNCSYGVPQFNAERGVIGKCDMCHNRLADDMAPACADACPEQAITIELVNVEQWRKHYEAANSPGMPSADDSISTTRITLPKNLPPDMGRVDTQQFLPEHAHPPLVLMLVLTQMSVGAFVSLWLLDRAGVTSKVLVAALISLMLAGISLAASTSHLGRPAFAWRALRALRTSWLSREVLMLSVFAGIASLYAGFLLLGRPEHTMAGMATAIAGFAGVFCSARIYTVLARPAWNSPLTILDFFSTAFLLGPLMLRPLGFASSHELADAAVAGAVTQFAVQGLKLGWLSTSKVSELRGSAQLLTRRFRDTLYIRFALLLIGGIILPLASNAEWTTIAALTLALVGEFVSRWLFFVTVVPKNMAAAFVLGGGH